MQAARKSLNIIRLRNGSQFSLSPYGEANHFRDQNGHKVKRRMDGETQKCKWEERAVRVHFHGGSHSGHDYHSGHHRGGNTVPACTHHSLTASKHG